MAKPNLTVERVNMPAVARKRLIAIFVLGTALLSVGAFVAGLFVRAPSAVLDDTAGSAVPVFASAELRVVEEGLVVQAITLQGPQTTISGAGVSESPRAVVTSINISEGQELASGQLIGAVSNRPVFTLALRLPLYRDIVFRDAGPDVASLQASLGVPQSGTFDNVTRAAFAQLYTSNGYSPPGGRASAAYVRLAEVVSIGSVSVARVTHAAALGDELTSDLPLAVIETGPVRVGFRANVREFDQLSVGQAVEVQTAGEVRPGVVSSIGPFAEASSGESGGSATPGYDVIVDLQSAEGLQAGISALVTTAVDDASAQLAVPTAAVRGDGSKNYVWVQDASDVIRVPVVVTAQANGWVGLESDGLTVGDKVRVWP